MWGSWRRRRGSADAAAKAKPDAAKAEIAKNRHDEAAMASKYIHELDLLFCAVEPVDDVPVLPQDPQLVVKVDDPAARPLTPPQPRPPAASRPPKSPSLVDIDAPEDGGAPRPSRDLLRPERKRSFSKWAEKLPEIDSAGGPGDRPPARRESRLARPTSPPRKASVQSALLMVLCANNDPRDPPAAPPAEFDPVVTSYSIDAYDDEVEARASPARGRAFVRTPPERAPSPIAFALADDDPEAPRHRRVRLEALLRARGREAAAPLPDESWTGFSWGYEDARPPPEPETPPVAVVADVGGDDPRSFRLFDASGAVEVDRVETLAAAWRCRVDGDAAFLDVWARGCPRGAAPHPLSERNACERNDPKHRRRRDDDGHRGAGPDRERHLRADAPPCDWSLEWRPRRGFSDGDARRAMHAVAAALAFARGAARRLARDAADPRGASKVRVAGHVEDDDALAAAPAPARPDETPFKVQQLRRESLTKVSGADASSWGASFAPYSSWKSLEDQALGLMLRPLRATYDVGDLGPARFDFLGKFIARRDFVVVNGRGQRLRASRWAADDAPPAAPTVLCLHGNQSSRVEGLHYLALVLELGCALVAVDCAGSGKSDGDRVSLGLREAADASDVVDALYATHGTPPEKIVVWGRSMGASAALLCAADHQPGLAGLILDSPFASLVKLVNDLTKHAARSKANPDGKSTFASLVDGAADVAADALIRVVRARLVHVAGFAVDDVVPEDRAAAVDAPGGVLLIAGDRDAIVPPKRNAAPILAALDARPGRAGDAALVRCERAGHDGCRPLAVYRAARRHLAAALALDASAADLADLITVAPAPDDAPRHVYLAVPWQIHAALEKKRLAQTSHAAPGPVPDRRESADHLLAEISRIQRELESIQGGEA